MPREKFKLWVGKNDRVMPPGDVQLRIVNRYKGCCAGCQVRLMGNKKPEFDHVIAIEDGGVNAEGNIQPLCRPCHLLKTGRENSERAKVRAKAKAAYGITRPKAKIPSRPKAAKPPRDVLPPPRRTRDIFGRAL